jgi:hypothetical protein
VNKYIIIKICLSESFFLFDIRPEILESECTVLKAYSTFSLRVIAKSMCPNVSINEIQVLGPHGLLS